ncbi:MAG TPA: MFS transporter [Eubacteriales bacterium]|nr:MFS transporter [Eubacteriales bacterium]
MKLNYKRTFFVGLAFFLICVFWQAYDTLIAISLVNKFGMNQTWSGVIMALDNVLALFMLPLFGTISDNAHGPLTKKLGKRTPFILIGTIIAVICFFSLSVVDANQLKSISSVSNTETISTALWDNNYEIDNPYYGVNKEKSTYDLTYIDTTIERGTIQQIFTGGEDMFKAIKLDNDNDAVTVASALDIQTADPYIYNPYYNKTENVPAGVNTTLYRGHLSEIYTGSYTFVEIYNGVYGANPDDSFVTLYKPLVSAANSGAKTTFTGTVAALRSAYVSEITANDNTNLVMFILILLVLLITMATFRSPAVALMPAVTVKPLRSKANAIINIMGVIGGSLVLGLGMVLGTGQASNALMNYIPFISICCGIMLIALVIFLITVREPKFCDEMEKITAENHLDDEPATQTQEVGHAKAKMDKSKLRSFIFLLLSIAFWFMGYNAVTSKYSLYALNVLQMDYNTTLLIAQIAALIAFFPAGMLATKIGRKKTIMGGIVLLTASFIVASFMNSNSSVIVMNILFILAGIAWASINVNSLPMVVELATGADVGKYTGFYYTASMAAQTVTPILSGGLMDGFNTMEVLFPYASIFVALSFVTMIFVRHGDSKPIAPKNVMESIGEAD